MARLWEDQPDYYDTSTITTPGWAAGSAARVISGGGRRTGTNALSLIDGAGGGTLQKTLAPADSKVVIAFAMRFDRMAEAITSFFAIGDATVWHLSMGQNLDGTLSLYLGRSLLSAAGGSLIETIPFAPVIDTYYHFSLESVIADAVGSLSLRINKVEQLNGGAGYSNIDTRNGGTAGWTRFAWGIDTSGARPPRVRWCDMVVNDGSGGANDTHPGDCGVYVSMPNANGGVREFTPSTGTDDFAVLDEVPPNDVTDYIESTAVNQRTTVGFPALGAVGLVKSLTFRHRLALDAAGSGQAVGVMRKSGTNHDSAVTLSPTEAWAYFDDRRIVDPATGVAFTVNDVDAIEGGIKRSA